MQKHAKKKKNTTPVFRVRQRALSHSRVDGADTVLIDGPVKVHGHVPEKRETLIRSRRHPWYHDIISNLCWTLLLGFFF